MSLSLAEIRRVIEEARPLVVGGRLDNATQTSPTTLVLTFHAHRTKQNLLLCANPQFARLHLTADRPPGTGAVPPFTRAVRQALRNVPLAEIGLVGDDRVAELVFGRADAPAGRLVAELTGRSSNLYLVSGDGRVLASIRPAAKAERSLAPGNPYLPPPPRPPSLEPGADRFPDAAPPSEAIERFYAAAEAEERTRVFRSALTAYIRTTRKRTERLLANLEGDVASDTDPEQLRLFGELLKFNLHDLPLRRDRVSLVNLFDPEAPVVEVPLQSSLSPRQNMERYFHRYKRLTAARQQAAERLLEGRRRLDALGVAAVATQAATTLEELERVADDVGFRRAAEPSKRRPHRAEGPHRFRSAEGLDILVGRSAAENSELTFHLARGNDLWLHVEGYTGSHVVVRVPKGKTVPKESLLDAATLAVHFSQLRRAGGGPVAYCACKYVTRPRGASPGQALYSQSKTLHVTVERLRLDRLMHGEPAES